MMRKILFLMAVFTITVASAQTKPAQKKADGKECCQGKKACTKEEESKASHCSPDSKGKVSATAKKNAVKA